MTAGLHVQVAGKAFTQIVGGVNPRTARVLFFGKTKQVGRITDLGLHLLFAVTEIIVGDEGHHHPAGVAGAELKGGTFIVDLVLGLPAHAVAALARRREIPMRQTERNLGYIHEMRSQNHAAGMPRPTINIESGIVLR